MTITPGPRAGLPDFLDGFAASHDAMLRDVHRLAAAVMGGADLAALDRWFGHFRRLVEHHHHREDEVLWPELRRRSPSVDETTATLAADHGELDRRLAAVSSALGPRRSRKVAIPATAALAALLDDHLAREEATAFPAIAASFTAEEYVVVEKAFVKGTPFSQLRFELPWLLDGLAPDRAAPILALLPAPLLALHRTWFERSYRRLVAPLT